MTARKVLETGTYPRTLSPEDHTMAQTLYLSLRDAVAVAERDALKRAHDRVFARLGDTRAAADIAHPIGAAWAAHRETVLEACAQCGAAHDAVWFIRRVVADTLGPWNVYRINGAPTTLPGGGLPLTLDTLPRDAVRVAPDAAAAFWHAG